MLLLLYSCVVMWRRRAPVEHRQRSLCWLPKAAEPAFYCNLQRVRHDEVVSSQASRGIDLTPFRKGSSHRMWLSLVLRDVNTTSRSRYLRRYDDDECFCQARLRRVQSCVTWNRVRHDDILQRDRLAQNPRRAQRLLRHAPQPALHRHPRRHFCCAGVLPVRRAIN